MGRRFQRGGLDDHDEVLPLVKMLFGDEVQGPIGLERNPAELTMDDVGEHVRDGRGRQHTTIVVGQSLNFTTIRMSSGDGNLSFLVHADIHPAIVRIVILALVLDDHCVAVAVLVA